MIRISNFTGKNGRPVVNQFIIETGIATYFQSYESVVAKVERDGTIKLGPDWDYSRTTGKYLHQFLADYAGRPDLNTKEAIQKAIDSEEIILVDNSEEDYEER